jgi:hypothetical protein
MKVIKSYTEASSLNLFCNNSKKVLFSLYSASKENFKYWLVQRKNKKISLSKKQEVILKLLDNKTSIWLDGFGFALRDFNNKIISIEQYFFKNILNKINNNYIYFSNNLFSEKSLNIINKKFISDVVVVDSQIFDYTTTIEIISFLKNLYKIFKQRKLIICIDLKKIDFNKLKFTNNEILEEILRNLNIKNKLHILPIFECILELN